MPESAQTIEKGEKAKKNHIPTLNDNIMKFTSIFFLNICS